MEPLFVGIDTESVIQAVRSRPLLWNYTETGYSNKAARSLAWLDVCRELLPDWDTHHQRDQYEIERKVQQRWRTARDCYVKTRTQELKGRADVQRYGYSELLTFLEPTLRVPIQYVRGVPAPPAPATATKRSFTMRKKKLLVSRAKAGVRVGARDDGPPSPSPAGPAGDAAPAPAPAMTAFERRLLASLAALGRRERDSPLDEDDENFFKSLGPILREFNAAQKLQFRSKVLATAMAVRETRERDAVYLSAASEDGSALHSPSPDLRLPEDPIEEKYTPPDRSPSPPSYT